MSTLAILFDVAPTAGIIGAAAAAVFLLVLLGVAFVAFKALKRTVTMAFRLAIVGAILIIAVVGSASLWYFSSAGSAKPPARRVR